MTVRRLQPDGDITTSGSHFIQSSVDDIAQTITTRLKLFFGEYFRDNQDGTRWFESILGKGNTSGSADAEIRRRISQTEGVTGILKYNSTFDAVTRVFSVTCTVLTIYGELDFATSQAFQG